MKKNKALRAAGALMIAVLLTTCLTAGTFAKYTTSGSAQDSARVAKFGVTVSANGSLYGSAYDGTAHKPADYTAGADTLTVKAGTDASDNVVAPGTKNESGLGFALNGKPETDVQITGYVEAKNIFLASGEYGVMTKVTTNTITSQNFGMGTYYIRSNGVYSQAAAFDANVSDYYVLKDTASVTDIYYPVVYSLNGTAGTTAAQPDSAAAIAKTVADKLQNGTASADSGNRTGVVKYTFNKLYKNNTDLSAEVDLASEKLTWEWVFTAAGADAKDTILGDLQAQDKNDSTFKNYGEVVKKSTDAITNAVTYKAPQAGTDYSLETGFDISVTVEQAD